MTRPLIIAGAGIAGLWTALHAAPRRVILLTGAPLGQGASTAWAQGGVAAALGRDDAPDLHAADTIAAGAGLVDEAAAHILAEAGPGEVEALYALGAPFERSRNGEWALSREAAHSRARVARVKGDQAGAGILAALIKAVRAAGHVEIREGWRAEALLPASDGGCAGVLARGSDGVLVAVEGDVVLATGSLCGLYAVTTTPWTSQGQALAMAAGLGAVIRDPEFVQFHPTAIDIGRDPAPLATEALRGEGAILIDRSGRRFMRAVHPQAELAPRDVVARAVHRQLRTGKGAFLDARAAVGEAFPERFPRRVCRLHERRDRSARDTDSGRAGGALSHGWHCHGFRRLYRRAGAVCRGRMCSAGCARRQSPGVQLSAGRAGVRTPRR